VIDYSPGIHQSIPLVLGMQKLRGGVAKAVKEHDRQGRNRHFVEGGTLLTAALPHTV